MAEPLTKCPATNPMRFPVSADGHFGEGIAVGRGRMKQRRIVGDPDQYVGLFWFASFLAASTTFITIISRVLFA